MYRIKKINYFVIMITLLFVFTFGFNSFAVNKAISIGTGGITGTYYPLGGCIANIISQYVKDVFATAETTGGSIANMKMLQKGEAQLGFVGASSSYPVFAGLPPYDKEPCNKVRSIAALYPEAHQIVVLKKSGINSMADIKEKKFAVGAPGSGTALSAKIVLEEHEISYEDFKPVYLSFKEGVTALKDGLIDGAIIFAGAPTSSVINAASTLDVKLLSYDPAAKMRLLNDYEYFVEVTLPKDMYRGLDEDIYTLGTPALLVTSIDQDEEFIYEITKTLFEHTKELSNAHVQGKNITLENAIKGLSMPLHPGAERYYKEMGILK